MTRTRYNASTGTPVVCSPHCRLRYHLKADASVAAESYKNGKPAAEVAAELGLSSRTILNYVRRVGGKARSPAENRIYVANEGAFDCDPVTDEAAYFAGLLLTDGCVTGGQVYIELQERDRAIVENLNQFLGSSYPISERVRLKGTGPRCNVRLAISSPQMVQSLARYGVVPRKTAIAIAPDFLLHNRHFWRGCVDGDGWVYPSGRCGWSPRVGLCGTQVICEQFRDFVKGICPNDVTVYKDRRSEIVHSINYGRKGMARPIVNELYRDTDLAIPRKLAAAREIIGAEPAPDCLF